MLRTLPIAAIGALLLLGGCTPVARFLVGDSQTSPTGPAGKPGVGGRTEWTGTAAKAEDQQFRVARTADEWRDLWKLAGTPMPGSLPTGMMALGGFSGRRPTGGYGIVFVGLREVQDMAMPPQVVVNYRETVPPANAQVTPAPTSPWVIELERARDMPVQFTPEE